MSCWGSNIENSFGGQPGPDWQTGRLAGWQAGQDRFSESCRGVGTMTEEVKRLRPETRLISRAPHRVQPPARRPNLGYGGVWGVLGGVRGATGVASFLINKLWRH